MQSMVGVQFSRPPSPSRCIAIGSCQSFAPGRRNPKLGYPSLHFLVYPKFNSFSELTKVVPVSASRSEYVAGEELVSIKAVEEDSTSSSSAAPRSVSQDRRAEDEEESVLKSIVNLALPALGAVLSDPIMSLIDTGCVGQVSAVDLAALGPNTSIFNFIFQIFTFLGSTTCNLLAGISMRASSAAEQKAQQHQASQLLNHALFLAVTSGVAVCILMEALAPQLLSLMGAGPEYLKPALVYLRIRALSAPAVLILVVGQGACLGRQDATTPLQVNSMAAAFNLIGDALFTLYLGWGVAGAAWATLISQCVAVILLVRKLTGKSMHQQTELEVDLSEPLPLKLGWYGLPTLEVLGPFFALAGPLIVRCALSMTVYTLTTKGAAEFGTLSVAAHQVALQVFWTLSYFPEALSIAAQSLVARNLKSNAQRAQKLARMLLGFGTMLGVVLMGVVACVHYLGASWLTADPNVQQLVQSVTLQSMLCELLCSVALVVEGTSIAAGDVAYLPKMQFLNLVGVLFALWLTFQNNLGLGGIWWCLVCYFGFRVVFHSCYIASHWNTHVLGWASPLSILGG